MNCAQVRRALTALWDHELPEATARRMHGHLAGCPKCGAAWDVLNGVHQALRSDPASPVPPFLAARVSSAARQRLAERERRSWARLVLPVLRPTLVLRAVALAVLVTLGFLMGTSSPPPADAAARPADELEVFELLPPETPASVIVDVMDEPGVRS